jgi:oligopeptide transport system substrate-binding protein
MKSFPTKIHDRSRLLIAGFLLLCLCSVFPGCFPTKDSSHYYGRIVVPRRQEFRWSDGGLPQVFDPAFAAAPPDTDAVRALFEGLTDYDPHTLQPVPGVATHWESSEDDRVWTFYLREEARWSNGEPVTAGDFVRSWERTLQLGDQAPHTELLNNIIGARAFAGAAHAVTAPIDAAARKLENNTAVPRERPAGSANFGAEEISAHVLRVHLLRPNPNFPSLVAHPVFRPVKIAVQDANRKINESQLVSNGAFLLTPGGNGRVSMQRAENYWDKAQVNLERVEFVDTRDAEAALNAYRAGEVDAVTNAPFEPLALKLLAPYADYRRETYGALTYYSFNTAHRPFDDVRVREALAISIDRDRITEDEMGGATEPAHRFLPVLKSASDDEAVVAKSTTLSKDQARAKQLLAEAGYPEGRGFPTVRLLINRNDQQRQVAQAVATMWHSALKIETEIVVKSWDEYEAAIRTGDYDLVRRGAVLQSTDEFTNIRMLFPVDEKSTPPHPASPESSATPAGADIGRNGKSGAENSSGVNGPQKSLVSPIETEAEAMRRLTAIPIYFASSYALVKPYITGFDSNILDAPSLKSVRIDIGWKEQNRER